jgi:hypothetical protein
VQTVTQAIGHPAPANIPVSTASGKIASHAGLSIELGLARLADAATASGHALDLRFAAAVDGDCQSRRKVEPADWAVHMQGLGQLLGVTQVPGVYEAEFRRAWRALEVFCNQASSSLDGLRSGESFRNAKQKKSVYADYSKSAYRKDKPGIREAGIQFLSNPRDHDFALDRWLRTDLWAAPIAADNNLSFFGRLHAQDLIYRKLVAPVADNFRSIYRCAMSGVCVLEQALPAEELIRANAFADQVDYAIRSQRWWLLFAS